METLAVGLMCILCLCCVVGAIQYTFFISRGNARWLGALMIIVATGALVGSSSLLFLAPPIHPTLANMSGAYEDQYGDGDDTLLLHPNGTFDQRFVDNVGKIYNNHGTWQISDIEPSSVDFKHLLMTFDAFGQPQKPLATNFGGASSRLFDPSVYFNDDLDICMKKTSNKDTVWPTIEQ